MRCVMRSDAAVRRLLDQRCAFDAASPYARNIVPKVCARCVERYCGDAKTREEETIAHAWRRHFASRLDFARAQTLAHVVNRVTLCVPGCRQSFADVT